MGYDTSKKRDVPITVEQLIHKNDFLFSSYSEEKILMIMIDQILTQIYTPRYGLYH